MKATTLLRNQHRHVEQLVSALERERYVRRALLENLADDLAATLTIEEMLFHPAACEGIGEAIDDRAHVAVRAALQQCFEATDDTAFACALATLDERLRVHFAAEEAELFPRIELTFSPEELDRLGAKMTRLHREIVEADGDERVSWIGRPSRADWYRFAESLP